jgi:hypothetical protein
MKNIGEASCCWVNSRITDIGITRLASDRLLKYELKWKISTFWINIKHGKFVELAVLDPS